MFTNIFFPWWWACKCYHYPNTWRGFFFQFDKILDSKINNDWDTGRSRGFELVTFKCEHSMRDAIRGMNTVLFLSSLLSFALPSIDLISLIFYFLSGFSLSCFLCMFSSISLNFNWKQNLYSHNESGGGCWSTQPTSNGKVLSLQKWQLLFTPFQYISPNCCGFCLRTHKNAQIFNWERANVATQFSSAFL